MLFGAFIDELEKVELLLFSEARECNDARSSAPGSSPGAANEPGVEQVGVRRDKESLDGRSPHDA
jgi:hypothetical protein